VNTISQIFDAICEYGYPRYNELIVKLRKERREVESFGEGSIDKRIAIASTYTTTFNKLFEDLQKELLKHLGISQEDLFLSIESHAAKGDTQVLYLSQMLVEKMRMMKKSNKYINKDALMHILLFKRDFTLKHADKVRRLAENKKSDRAYLDSMLMDFASLVYDEIQKYFGYEEEDLVPVLQSPDVTFDMPLNSLLMETEGILKGLVPNFAPADMSLDTTQSSETPELKAVKETPISQ